jgi:hypothetical protein
LFRLKRVNANWDHVRISFAFVQPSFALRWLAFVSVVGVFPSDLADISSEPTETLKKLGLGFVFNFFSKLE